VVVEGLPWGYLAIDALGDIRGANAITIAVRKGAISKTRPGGQKRHSHVHTAFHGFRSCQVHPAGDVPGRAGGQYLVAMGAYLRQRDRTQHQQQRDGSQSLD
jgi:hypothetical protein